MKEEPLIPVRINDRVPGFEAFAAILEQLNWWGKPLVYRPAQPSGEENETSILLFSYSVCSPQYPVAFPLERIQAILRPLLTAGLAFMAYDIRITEPDFALYQAAGLTEDEEEMLGEFLQEIYARDDQVVRINLGSWWVPRIGMPPLTPVNEDLIRRLETAGSKEEFLDQISGQVLEDWWDTIRSWKHPDMQRIAAKFVKAKG